jgi:hypothetical protein
MGHVPVSVPDLSRAQFLEVPEEIYIMFIALQGRATDVLHGVPKGATYEEALEALEDRFGDQHLAFDYRSHLKTRTQFVGEFLQEFDTAVEQLAHRA